LSEEDLFFLLEDYKIKILIGSAYVMFMFGKKKNLLL
jgi:hypothetical protein